MKIQFRNHALEIRFIQTRPKFMWNIPKKEEEKIAVFREKMRIYGIRSFGMPVPECQEEGRSLFLDFRNMMQNMPVSDTIPEERNGQMANYYEYFSFFTKLENRIFSGNYRDAVNTLDDILCRHSVFDPRIRAALLSVLDTLP